MDWTIDELGVTGSEGTVFKFTVCHTGNCNGETELNESISYSDTEGNIVNFSSPNLTVKCEIPVTEPCPQSIDYLDIVKVAEVLDFEEESITFSCKSELVQSFYFASNKTSMCIGVKFNNCNDILFLCDEMDKANEITLRRNDELVLITY